MKVVLAYSGGLDTSVCIPLLRERYGFDEVIAVTVDIGQPPADIKEARARGSRLSDKHILMDAKEEYVYDYIFPLIKANGCYEGYVLGTAIARPLIARKVVEVALKENADAVAHGCTGKGNDQLRFEAVFRAANLKVVAPIRELNLTRREEMEYAREHGIEAPAEKRWSVDENIWNRSIEGGELEDPDFEPPEEIYKWTVSPEKAREPEIIEIRFERGVPVALNGEALDGVLLIRRLNEIGGRHGVGRTDILEDRVLGFKSREIYEHPAATILLTAHKDLERLVLTRNELRFKELVDKAWSELVYHGLIIDPLYEALNAFIDKTQERVTGEVRVKLEKGSARVVARRSPHNLLSKEVSFDAKTEQRAAEGFILYHSLQQRIFEARRHERA
ncbi:argininosuccinate synthase [Candidatus Alkanophaga liquidiphilum]|nr:Argininosuccinate synthase [Candidatus Alkanophaga liquidiphilum]